MVVEIETYPRSNLGEHFSQHAVIQIIGVVGLSNLVTLCVYRRVTIQNALCG